MEIELKYKYTSQSGEMEHSIRFPTRVTVTNRLGYLVVDEVFSEAAFLGFVEALAVIGDKTSFFHDIYEELEFVVGNNVNKDIGLSVADIGRTFINWSTLPIHTVDHYDDTNPEHQTKPLIWICNQEIDDAPGSQPKLLSENETGEIITHAELYWKQYENVSKIYIFDVVQHAISFARGVRFALGIYVIEDPRDNYRIRNLALPTYVEIGDDDEFIDPRSYRPYKFIADDIMLAGFMSFIRANGRHEIYILDYDDSIAVGFNDDRIRATWEEIIVETEEWAEREDRKRKAEPQQQESPYGFGIHLGVDLEVKFKISDLAKRTNDRAVNAAARFFPERPQPTDYIVGIWRPDRKLVMKEREAEAQRRVAPGFPYIPPNDRDLYEMRIPQYAISRWIQGVKIAAKMRGFSDVSEFYPLKRANGEIVHYH